ncbi:TolC family protein [Billgrantia kenyensis]|uniref:TolC family protein n=1 Tax=Billgrantia kenyensis TaxID=321266 RepID=A0A7W0ADX2_9GAMM|nr:TolC family protein [Halomonas kenyensis]MBA2778706.1 TolC family protein [Halomonas kenyensis]MCG6661768.1 TolC family protein [Halomonas kenyensis]
MNATAWTRLFIPPLLVLLLASAPAGAAELGLDPRLLPGGEADLPALQQELRRLAAGRTAPTLVPAPPGGGARLPGLARLETPALLTATVPFALEPLEGASRVLLIGPPGVVGPASESLAAEADARGIALVPLTVEPSRLPTVAELGEADVALLLALPEHDAPAQRRLLNKLAAAGVPGVALTDARQVERGALLSSPGALDREAWLRRLALRLDDTAAGRTPEPLESRPALDRAWLNLDTAARLDWSPSFTLLSQARLLGEAGSPDDKRLELGQAVALALADNLGLSASRQAVEVDAHERDLAASRYRPSLYLEATGRMIDETRARAALGQEPEHRVTGGVVLEQLLFSEPALAAIAVAGSRDRARRAELEVESLDLALEVAREFLDLLRLEASREVLEADLELARAQRDQAVRDEQAGAVGRGEVARFEAELTQARERLEQAVADRERLAIALNRRLGREPDASLLPVEPDLGRREWLGGDPRFDAALATPASLAAWQQRLVERALRDSAELAALGELRRAAERELSSRRRAFWVPEVGLEARYISEFSRSGAGERAPWESSHPTVQAGAAALEGAGVALPETGRDEWSVGLSARLPLYAGGRRSIERDRSAGRLEQVALEDAEARLGLEARLRAASVELAAAWRRIALRDEALGHAEEALALAEAGWREGALPQVALLDARTSARQAGLAAAEARWQALQALVHLQRALGVTPGPMVAEARDRLLDGVNVAANSGESR